MFARKLQHPRQNMRKKRKFIWGQAVYIFTQFWIGQIFLCINTVTIPLSNKNTRLKVFFLVVQHGSFLLIQIGDKSDKSLELGVLKFEVVVAALVV